MSSPSTAPPSSPVLYQSRSRAAASSADTPGSDRCSSPLSRRRRFALRSSSDMVQFPRAPRFRRLFRACTKDVKSRVLSDHAAESSSELELASPVTFSSLALRSLEVETLPMLGSFGSSAHFAGIASHRRNHGQH
ncbi:hypothetical protein KC323_g21 [Hortaea werneckii]|nr:hypothetical protein KC323_g21 [Hortaea werneckii]